MKKTYFSSDYHFDHARVIEYDQRPFETVEEMNETLIQNHNSVVRKNDDFYFLGDFSFNHKKMEEHISRLNGNLFFIRGNHDHKKHIELYKKYGTFLGEQKTIRVEGQHIALNHYAMRVWDRSHYGSWHLYGHSHGNLTPEPGTLSLDVGCMLYDYKPIEFEQILELFKN